MDRGENTVENPVAPVCDHGLTRFSFGITALY
jgi:hypothetical protein